MANYFKYYTRKKVLRNQFLLLSVKESMCQYKHKHTFWENFSEIYMESWWGNYFWISVIPGFHHSRVSSASFFFFFFFYFFLSVLFFLIFSLFFFFFFFIFWSVFHFISVFPSICQCFHFSFLFWFRFLVAICFG